MKRICTFGLLLVSAAFLLPSALSAATYYIATDGVDSATGTSPSAPLKSLTAALDKAQGGDTIHIGPGDHYDMTMTSDNYLGKVTAAVTIEGEGEATTVLHGRKTGSGVRQHGIYLNNSGAVLKNLALTDLFCPWQDDDSSYSGSNVKGAALMVNAGTAQVCRVFNNATGGNNGRIPPVLVSGTGVLLDSVITNNVQGVWGKGAGGLYVAGGEVRRCLIAFNQGPEKNSPNGVWVAGGTLADSVIYKNTPRSGGTGTYGVQASGGTVERCVIAGNKAVTAGGIGVTGSATVRNCLVVGNTSTTTASASAGGIYLGASGAKVHHVTVVGNTGAGGSDGVNAASGELRAAVLRGNGLVDCTVGGASVTGCCFPGGTGDNIDVDPMFAPNSFTYHPSVRDYDSYRIGRFSLCRNAGPVTPLVADDLLGNARPQAGGELSDLGCYELQPAGPGEFFLGLTTESATVPSGESIVFNAVSEGQDVTVTRYVWSVKTNAVTTSVTTTVPTLTVENAPGGACEITLTAYDADDRQVGTAENTVSVKPRDVYVATDGGNAYPYADTATAARTIAAALEAVYAEASRPGRIHVAAGDYPSVTTIAALAAPVEIIGQANAESVRLHFASGSLTSGITLNHPQALVCGVTVLGSTTCGADDGYLHGGAIHVSDGTVSNCVVTGFTTYGTRGMPCLAIEKGRVTMSAITNNSNSSAWSRGTMGIYMTGGIVERTSVSDNPFSGDRVTAGFLVQSGGTVRDCRFERNSVTRQCVAYTLGVSVSGGTFERNVIADNEAKDSNNGTTVGGLSVTGSAVVRNVLVSGNVVNATDATSVGGVLVNASGADVRHVTVVGNRSANGAGGIVVKSGKVRGSIAYGSAGGADMTITGGTVSHSCFPTADGTNGNISQAPGFADEAFRLSRSSPCRDAARYGETLATDDLEGNPRVPYGESASDYPDMGCYEVQASGDLVASLSTSVETHVGDTLALSVTLEGDDTVVTGSVWKVTCGDMVRTTAVAGPTLTMENVAAGRYDVEVTAYNASGAHASDSRAEAVKALPLRCYVATDGLGIWPYDTPATAATNLCEAVETVYATDARQGEVLVMPGVHSNQLLRSKGVYWSMASLDRNVAVIGRGARPEDVWLRAKSDEPVSAIVVSHPRARLENVTITAEDRNSLDDVLAEGLHVYGGTVSNCVVRDCDVLSGMRMQVPFVQTGGYVYGLRVLDCRPQGGYARVAFGAYVTGGTNDNCVLSGNGGRGDISTCSALSLAGGLVRNVTITNNYCYYESGSHPDKAVGATVSGGTLMNALIVRNRAVDAPASWTAGLRVAGGTVVNATVADNEGDGLPGEQMIYTSGTLVNSIVEGKSTGTPVGRNLVTETPVPFRNREKLDYSLTASAKGCIDTGDNARWMSHKAPTDLVGNPRIAHKVVDLGCYEYPAPGFMLLVR